LITLTVNYKRIEVADGTSVAAAVLLSDVAVFRRSVDGDGRGPLCGMGICFECRVTVDGIAHQRSCNILAANGMEIVTGE
jgi:aerobic-type carbon monoxide dehydrogenase small subunit (CoxS/CutS family)